MRGAFRYHVIKDASAREIQCASPMLRRYGSGRSSLRQISLERTSGRGLERQISLERKNSGRGLSRSCSFGSPTLTGDVYLTDGAESEGEMGVVPNQVRGRMFIRTEKAQRRAATVCVRLKMLI